MLEFIITGFLFTWVAGLFLPILLRFVILRKPIGKFLAIFLVSIVYFIQFVIATALNPERKSHAPLFLVAWAGYLILRKRKNTQEENKTKNTKFEIASLAKKPLNFWLLVISLALVLIATFSNQGKSSLEENFMKIYRLDGDFFKLILVYIFCSSLYFAFLSYKKYKLETVFIFILIAITLNPFFTFGFSGSLAGILELLAAMFFAYQLKILSSEKAL